MPFKRQIYFPKQKKLVRRVIFFYIFANFFNVWFNRTQPDSWFCFCIQLLWNDYLVEVQEENPALHICVVEKGRTVLLTFSGNCGYFYLILYQNSTSSIFLKIGCDMDSESILKNFSYPGTLKIYWSILHFEQIFY